MDRAFVDSIPHRLLSVSKWSILPCFRNGLVWLYGSGVTHLHGDEKQIWAAVGGKLGGSLAPPEPGTQPMRTRRGAASGGDSMAEPSCSWSTRPPSTRPEHLAEVSDPIRCRGCSLWRLLATNSTHVPGPLLALPLPSCCGVACLTHPSLGRFLSPLHLQLHLNNPSLSPQCSVDVARVAVSHIATGNPSHDRQARSYGASDCSALQISNQFDRPTVQLRLHLHTLLSIFRRSTLLN